MINPITGEVISDNEIDDLIQFLKEADEYLRMVNSAIFHAKESLYKLANFGAARTARIKGNKYSCKIELPTKVAWDQKKLAHIYNTYAHGTPVDMVVKMGTYKVDMREFKKITTTFSNNNMMFNQFKDDLMSANLGFIGTPRFIIE